MPSPSTLEHEISGHHAPAGQRLPNPRFRELPRLTRLEALWSGPSLARWRALLLDVARDAAGAFGRALEAPVSIEDLGTAAGASPIAGFSFTAGLGAGLGICEARLCPSLVAGLLEALTRSAAAPIAGRPDPVTAAVLGHGALLACNALRDAAIARPRLVSSAALRSGSPNVSLEVALRIGEHAGHLQLRLDEISARALARALDENTAPAEAESHGRGATSGAGSLAPSATREEGEAEPAKDVRVGAMSQLLTAAGHLPSRAQVVMGPVRLSARSVASLRPGDVVCPDPAARFVEGKVRGPALLVSSRGPGARCAIGTLDGLTFSITALGHPTPTAQEPEMPTQGPSHDTLPIDVHVVLETLPMTLAELARVGEGTVVQLSSPPSRVRLRAADHTVAVGELVDIEGVLGVRVIEGGSR